MKRKSVTHTSNRPSNCGNTTTTHDTEPQLGGARIFSYLGNEGRGHKGKGAKYEIEKFILACSVHHPSKKMSCHRK